MAKASRTNGDYWKKRFTALEDDQYRKGAAYYKDLQKQFQTATNNIQIDIERWYGRLADNNNISLAGAKELLKAGELDEFKWSVDQYIKAGKENALDQRWMMQLENASARHHISYLEAMKLQVQQHAEVLFTEYDGGIAGFLNQAYSNRYYHTAFEISKGTGVGTNLAELDTRKIDAILRRPWAQDGASFSDRIWTNKQKLVSNLHTELTQNIIRGSSPQKAISRLAKEMGVSKAQAARLVMTESAAISSIAQQECLKALGVEKFEILATLDSRTSVICREMDGRIFDMVDFEVGTTAPPFHPSCRSVVTPHFEDDFGAVEERAARDPETGETVLVDGKLTYPEWKEQFVEKDHPVVNGPGMLKPKGKVSSADRDQIDHEIALIPEAHRGALEQEIEKITIDPMGNSRYDRTTGTLFLAPDLVEGEVIHEVAHALETKFNVWADLEFIRALKSTLGEENQLFYVFDDADTFTKPIQRLNRGDILVSLYQGRIYEEIGAADTNWEFNYYSLGDFFSEAYKEYILRPDVLKAKQPLIYAYIERMK